MDQQDRIPIQMKVIPNFDFLFQNRTPDEQRKAERNLPVREFNYVPPKENESLIDYIKRLHGPNYTISDITTTPPKQDDET